MATVLPRQVITSPYNNNYNNENNNNQFLYSTFHTRRASQSASNIITPGHWALNSFLKPSQLPDGEYAVCATLICATRLNQSQEPSLPSHVPIYPWVERSNYS